LLIDSFNNSYSNFDKEFISLEYSGLILIIVVIEGFLCSCRSSAFDNNDDDDEVNYFQTGISAI